MKLNLEELHPLSTRLSNSMRVWHCVILTIFTTQAISGSNHKLWYSLQGFPDNAGGIIPAGPKTVNGTYRGVFFSFLDIITLLQKIENMIRIKNNSGIGFLKWDGRGILAHDTFGAKSLILLGRDSIISGKD